MFKSYEENFFCLQFRLFGRTTVHFVSSIQKRKKMNKLKIFFTVIFIQKSNLLHFFLAKFLVKLHCGAIGGYALYFKVALIYFRTSRKWSAILGLSFSEWCWLPRESLLRGSSAPGQPAPCRKTNGLFTWSEVQKNLKNVQL